MSQVLTEEQHAAVVAGRKRFEEIRLGLEKPFPDEAYSTDSSRGFDLTSIKAQYVVERLNQVCGIDGWELKGDYTSTEDGILFFGTLVINDGYKGHQQQAVGFSGNKRNSGDAYKGAKTDALSKAASLFGLGNEVFKGNVAPPKKSAPKKKAPLKKVAVDF